jgi:hypothetical protein
VTRPGETRTTAPPVHAARRGAPLFDPVRNPIDRSGMCFRVKFFSQKNARLVRCESLLEAKVLRLLEFARDVVSYSEQPPKLRIRLSGRSRNYTPDFAVRWRDGAVWILEVKPIDIAVREEMQERFAVARAAAASQGMQYRVIGEPQVGRPGFKDIERLLESRRRLRTENLGLSQDDLVSDPASVDVALNRLSTVLSGVGELPVSEVVGLLDFDGCGRRRFESLLASRLIAWCIDQPLRDSTLIHLFTESDDEQLFA